MLDYAAKLTVAPWRIALADIEGLRSAGWSDREILEVNQVCAFYNLMSRTAHGLGVELDEMFGVHDRDYERHAAALRAAIIAGEAP